MRTLKILATVLVLAALGAPAGALDNPAPLTADDLNTWLDGYLPYALHTGDIAGAVVAVLMILHPSTPTAVVPASPTPIPILPADSAMACRLST